MILHMGPKVIGASLKKVTEYTVLLMIVLQFRKLLAGEVLMARERVIKMLLVVAVIIGCWYMVLDYRGLKLHFKSEIWHTMQSTRSEWSSPQMGKAIHYHSLRTIPLELKISLVPLACVLLWTLEENQKNWCAWWCSQSCNVFWFFESSNKLLCVTT